MAGLDQQPIIQDLWSSLYKMKQVLEAHLQRVNVEKLAVGCLYSDVGVTGAYKASESASRHALPVYISLKADPVKDCRFLALSFGCIPTLSPVVSNVQHL